MSQSIETIKTDIAEMKASHKEGMLEIKNMLATHAAEEKTWWQNSMSEKANKWVEKAVIIAITGIVCAAAALVWSSTIKNTQQRAVPSVVNTTNNQ